jgi:hypothetical protein
MPGWNTCIYTRLNLDTPGWKLGTAAFILDYLVYLEVPGWSSKIILNYTWTFRVGAAAFILNYTSTCQVGAVAFILDYPGRSGLEQLHLYSTIRQRARLEQLIYSTIPARSGLEQLHLYSTVPGRSGLEQLHLQYIRPYRHFRLEQRIYSTIGDVLG